MPHEHTDREQHSTDAFEQRRRRVIWYGAAVLAVLVLIALLQLVR